MEEEWDMWLQQYIQEGRLTSFDREGSDVEMDNEDNGETRRQSVKDNV